MTTVRSTSDEACTGGACALAVQVQVDAINNSDKIVGGETRFNQYIDRRGGRGLGLDVTGSGVQPQGRLVVAP